MPLDRGHPDLRRDGIAVSLGICRVEQPHDLEVDLAALQRKSQQVVGRHGLLGQALQGLVEERVYAFVLFPEDQRVVGVGGHPLQAVDDQPVQPSRIRAELLDLQLGGNRFSLVHESADAARGSPGRGSLKFFRGLAAFGAGILVKLAGPFLHLVSL